MSTRNGTAAALAVALAAFAPLEASAQILDPPGSDRAGKAARVDAPPRDPAPAPSARPLAGQDSITTSSTPVTTKRPVRTLTPVINTHQIDRFDALQKLQANLADNPTALADWIILGELSQEVAMDVSADMADKYFAQSRDAFEKALALDPSNPGLKAAVRFARDQASQVKAFETSRDAATDTFLAARRRDLKAMRHTPSIRVVSTMPPLPARELPAPMSPSRVNAVAPAATPASARAQAVVDAGADPRVNAAETLTASPGEAVPVAEAAPAITPAREKVPSTDAANYGTQANYSAASPVITHPEVYLGPTSYQPFLNAAGAPYTYQQYSASYFPTNAYNNPAFLPMTFQRYGTLPASQVVPNVLERQILNRPVAVPAR